MKTVNGMTVYEGADKCSLDEYSAKMATEVPKLIKENKYNDEVIKKEITEIKNKNEFQDKDIENLQQKNIQLQEELEQTKTNLENYAIHGKSTGEYIHLTDSSETDCRVDVRGNAKQATREGYNELLQNRRTNTTIKGITVVYNEDGTIKASGTATDNTDIPLCGQWDSTVVQFVLKKGTHRLNLWTNVPTLFLVKGTSAKSLSNQKDLVLTEDYEVTNAFLRIAKGAAINATIKPLLYLYEGQDKPYEQHGVSPSLDYPSKIETVGSNKNVFNDEKVKGLIVTTESMKNTELMDISLANNKYYIARIWFEDGTYATGNNFMLYGYNSSNQNIASIPNGQAKIHTNATEIAKIRIVTNITGIETYENKKIKGIKIEETDENGIATSYSSFGQGSVKVTSCNKNLLDVGENNYSTMGLNITLDKSRIKINGTPTSNNYILKKDNINGICLGKFKKGTYHITRQQFSGFTKKGNGFSVQIRKDAYDGTTLVSYGMETILQQKKFVLNEDVDLYLTMWANKDDIYNDVEFLFSIYSDNDVNYVQHEEQSYIMPIQAEMLEGDDFDKVNKKEVHNWEKRIWNGTENWTLDAQNTNDEYISFRTQIEDMVSLNSQNTQLITDKIINEYGGITLNKEHLWVYGINVVVCIKKERLESLDVLGFKKYLTQNNVIVYYKLAEPKKLDLTQEQIQALEKLDKLKTYKNITNITTDSIAMLDVDYKKDLETWQNQQDDRIKALEELVSTTQTSAMLIENLENDLLKEV